MPSIPLALGDYQRFRFARGLGPSLAGFAAYAARRRAIRWVAPPLVALRRRLDFGGALGRRMAQAWLLCWRGDGLRFEVARADGDRVFLWEARAPRDLALMARLGALRWDDPAPPSHGGRSSRPLWALVALNSAQAASAGCDSSEAEDWLSALRALISSASETDRSRLWSGSFLPPLAQSPNADSISPDLACFFLTPLAFPVEPLLDRAEQAGRALLLNFHEALALRPSGSELSGAAALALAALDGLDPRGEALWALAQISEGSAALERQILANPGALRHAAARAFHDRLALTGRPQVSPPPSRALARSL